jgi:hypothetical protein
MSTFTEDSNDGDHDPNGLTTISEICVAFLSTRFVMHLQAGTVLPHELASTAGGDHLDLDGPKQQFLLYSNSHFTY